MSSDIRTRATRSMIRSAFRSLIDEGERELTVSKIAARAGISRPTFYAHYRDLYDLIAEDELEELGKLGLEDFELSYRDPAAKAEIFTRVLEYLDENERLYRYYFSEETANYFSLVLQDIMARVAGELLRRGVFESREQAELCVLYHTSGLMAALRQWLGWGKAKPCTREEYAKMLAEASALK